MSPRPQSEDKLLQFSIPEFTVVDWELNSNLIQSEIISSNTNNNNNTNMLNTTDVIRRHSAR